MPYNPGAPLPLPVEPPTSPNSRCVKLAFPDDDKLEEPKAEEATTNGPKAQCILLGSYVQRQMRLEESINAEKLSELRKLYTTVYYGDQMTIVLNYRRLLEEAWKCLLRCPDVTVSSEELAHCAKKDFGCLIEIFQNMIDDKDRYRELLSCRDEQAQIVLDTLQDLLDSNCKTRYSLSAFRKTLIRLSRESELHPRCLTVHDMKLIGEHPVTGGSFADIWKGSIQSMDVATKIIRVFNDSDKKALLQEFLREALIWRQLKHPNLLPFFGLFKVADGRLCLLSPWMSSGNMGEFIKKNFSADRMLLSHDISHGVEFLHSQRVVHGDLKGLNILITSEGRACIADFGLATLMETKARVFTGMSTHPVKGGTARWQAPEIHRDGSENTFSTDIYALGSVFYELFTGELPFRNQANETAVIVKVINGVRPERPTVLHVEARLADAIWSLMSRCWQQEPSHRPSASSIVRFIHECGENQCPAPDWELSRFSEVRQQLQAYPLCPTINDISRILAR